MKKERSKIRVRGIRQVNGRWEYRFMIDGREHSRVTDLKATERNLSKVAAMLEIHRRQVLAGTALDDEKVPFSRATEAFLQWSKANRKPNTARRHRTSAASLVHFFRDQRINTIRPGHLENYKTWRAECQIKAVSIRHDLHAASQLFQFAQKQGWCETNPSGWLRCRPTENRETIGFSHWRRNRSTLRPLPRMTASTTSHA